MITMTGTIGMIAVTIGDRTVTGARTIALPRTMSVPVMTTGAMPVRLAGTDTTATGGVITVISVIIAAIVQVTGTRPVMAIIA